jgi:hypothetical protein
MPLLRNFADILTDLERLLAAADNNAELLPGVELARAPLEAAIASLRSLSQRRDGLNADKQALSAELKSTFQQARDAGSQFRGFVRAHLGMRNEKLVEFRIPPRRLGAFKRASPAKEPGPGTSPTPAGPKKGGAAGGE